MAGWKDRARVVDPAEAANLVEVPAEEAAPTASAAPTDSSSTAFPLPGMGADEAAAEQQARDMRDRALRERIAKRPVSERSLATGLKQGATFSFADELAGLAGGLGATVGGAAPLSEFPEYYRQARDEERQRLAEGRAVEPFEAGAGQVASSLLLPLGAAKGALTPLQAAGRGAAVGAATGAATGLGETKTLDADEVVPSVLRNAGFGAVTGAAVPAVAGALQGGAQSGASLLRKPLAAAGERADELRLLTPAAATGGTISRPRILQEATMVPGGVPAAADMLRQSGISRGLTTAGGINKRARAAMEVSGREIGRMLDDATARGGQVDVDAIVARLREAGAEAGGGMQGGSFSGPAEAEALFEVADRIERIGRRGYLFDEAGSTARNALVGAPDEAKVLSGRLADDAASGYRAAKMGNSPSAPADAAMQARRAVEDEIRRALESVGIEPGAYQGTKTLNQVSRIAKDASDVSLGRADKNNFFSLADIGTADAAGGGMTGAAAALGRKALGPLAGSARATGAEVARDLADRLGRFSHGTITPSAAGAQASGALGAAVMGSISEPLTTEGMTSEDQALVNDLRRRGMSDEEIASIIGVDARGTTAAQAAPASLLRPRANP